MKNSKQESHLSQFKLKPQQALPLYKLSITEKVVQAVQSMLLPQEGSLSIHTSLPATGDGSSPVMAAVRLLAEIRTRLVNSNANAVIFVSNSGINFTSYSNIQAVIV